MMKHIEGRPESREGKIEELKTKLRLNRNNNNKAEGIYKAL